MNFHPFELKIETLENINKELENITEQEAKQAIGGAMNFWTTALVGEEAGSVIKPYPRFTLALIGEEGGYPQPIKPYAITRACFETGC